MLCRKMITRGNGSPVVCMCNNGSIWNTCNETQKKSSHTHGGIDFNLITGLDSASKGVPFNNAML